MWPPFRVSERTLSTRGSAVSPRDSTDRCDTCAQALCRTLLYILLLEAIKPTLVASIAWKITPHDELYLTRSSLPLPPPQSRPAAPHRDNFRQDVLRSKFGCLADANARQSAAAGTPRCDQLDNTPKAVSAVWCDCRVPAAPDHWRFPIVDYTLSTLRSSSHAPIAFARGCTRYARRPGPAARVRAVAHPPSPRPAAPDRRPWPSPVARAPASLCSA